MINLFLPLLEKYNKQSSLFFLCCRVEIRQKNFVVGSIIKIGRNILNKHNLTIVKNNKF